MDLLKLSQFLQKCSLHVITVEDWILIQRSSFDLHIDDLPYHSIQIYVKMTTRSYVVRDGFIRRVCLLQKIPKFHPILPDSGRISQTLFQIPP